MKVGVELQKKLWLDLTKIWISHAHLVNPFVPKAPFLCPVKTSENFTLFWCFQEVEKKCIENKWVNGKGQQKLLTTETRFFYKTWWFSGNQINCLKKSKISSIYSSIPFALKKKIFENVWAPLIKPLYIYI